MTRLIVGIALLSALLVVVPISASERDEARRQVAFGIEVASHGLWREAAYRWERAVEIDPSYAEAFNNLGVAYEHEGDIEKARAAYQKAVALAPAQASIKENFELFNEVNPRASGPDSK
jgi:Flp pilus assembly protein TadD